MIKSFKLFNFSLYHFDIICLLLTYKTQAVGDYKTAHHHERMCALTPAHTVLSQPGSDTVGQQECLALH